MPVRTKKSMKTYLKSRKKNRSLEEMVLQRLAKDPEQKSNYFFGFDKGAEYGLFATTDRTLARKLWKFIKDEYHKKT